MEHIIAIALLLAFLATGFATGYTSMTRPGSSAPVVYALLMVAFALALGGYIEHTYFPCPEGVECG